MSAPAPRISILMASYGHAAYIAEAIRSVQAQTDPDWELIIVDDASTDETLAVVQPFLADPRIRLTPLTRQVGQYAATNQALSQARGEFIGILNSDDCFYPEKLARQRAYLEAHPETAAVFTQVRVIGERGEDAADWPGSPQALFDAPNRSHWEWLRLFFRLNNALCHPSVLIRRACHEQLGGYDPRLGNLGDLDFWIRLCFHHALHILPERLTGFRLRDRAANMGAAKQSTWTRQDWEWLSLLDHYRRLGSADTLTRIFPEICDEPAAFQLSAPWPYPLAQWALLQGTAVHHRMACQWLHGLLADPEAAALLARHADFTFADYIALTGRPPALGEPTYADRQAAYDATLAAYAAWEGLRQHEPAPLGRRLRDQGIERVAIYGTLALARRLYEECRQAGVTVVTFLDQDGGRAVPVAASVPVQPPTWVATHADALDAILLSIEGPHDTRILQQLASRLPRTRPLPILSWKMLAQSPSVSIDTNSM